MRLIRCYVPVNFVFPIMKHYGIGSDNDSLLAEDAPDVAFNKWYKRLEKHNLSIVDKHVLEVGSGRHARQALYMLAAGASHVTLIDPYAVSLKVPKHKMIIRRDCRKLGLEFDEILTRIKVIRGDIMLLPVSLLHKQADLVISDAVLEHISDPKLALAKCWEYLKPGGITLHNIDLRDHYYDYPFEMLTFSDRIWKRWLNPKGIFHLNRWRASDYIQAVSNEGFVNVGCLVYLKDEAGLKAIFPRLDTRFRGMSKEYLSALRILLYGEKPRILDDEN